MTEHPQRHNLSEPDIERLLRNAPAPERVRDERRTAIWENVSAHLEGTLTRSSPFPARHARWVRSLPWAGATLATAAALLIVALILGRNSRVSHALIGKVETLRGESVRLTADGAKTTLTKGDSLNAGDRLAVGHNGGVRLHLTDGSTLWLCADTEAVCGGPRGTATPTMRLTRGELRADIGHSEKDCFSIETPVAKLRVLGTEFHCRVLTPIQEEDATMQQLRTALKKAIPVAVVVTVLSGSVAVETAHGEQIVREAERTVVTSGTPQSPAETVRRVDYSRNWLGEPTRQITPEALVFVPARTYLLHGLYAVNLETGAARHVTDFVACGPSMIQPLATGVVTVNATSVLFAHFGTEPISGGGRPFVDNQIFLVNLNTGDKIPMTPLRHCDPLYMEISPDHRKLAFVGDRRTEGVEDPEFGLFVLDLETFGLERVLEGAIKTCPHWSPDSRWLAISKSPGYTDTHQIVLIDTITGDALETGLAGAGAHFSPDGKRLLFSAGFTKGGSWSAGVPTWGNLFMADVPNGAPEQVTSLPAGGAINPAFSPDGSHVAYWDASAGFEKPAVLHVLDLNSREDRIVTEGEAFASLQWLDANSRLLLTGRGAPKEGGSAPVRLIELLRDTVTVREIAPVIPELSAAQERSVALIADRLLRVFSAYRDAVNAQDAHRIEDAQAKYREARDLLATLIKEQDAAGKSAPVRIGRDDLAAYLDAFEKEAALTPAERSVKVVHENLEWYMCSLLSTYYRKNQMFPAGPAQLAEWAPGEGWQINHIQSSDTDRVRRLFVVPGDDPDKVTTSYELVRSDEKEGVWVLRTPALADGKRLQATYRFKTKGSHAYAEVVELP